MKKNPYKNEIIATILLGPLLMMVETWRRWDNLLSMSYFDDVILVVLASISTYFLYHRQFIGQLLWLFTAGTCFMMINISFFWAIEEMHLPDASGIPKPQVILVKGGMYLIILLMSWRAFRLLMHIRFENDFPKN